MKISLDGNAIQPTRAHATDAGLDLYCPSHEVIRPFDHLKIDLGVHVQIPPNHVGFIKGRSSMNAAGMIVAEGTIDEGYTGPLGVVVFNMTGEVKIIDPYDRIAQLVIQPVKYPLVKVVDSLEPTERGDGGFGSTGA